MFSVFVPTESSLKKAVVEDLTKLPDSAVWIDLVNPSAAEDRAVERLAVLRPRSGRLALIGDADGDDVPRGRAGLLHGAAAAFHRRRPQIVRLVLDLAVGGKMLREFLLRESRDRGVGPEQAGPGRGRALVDG